jgi:hypothetical protein
MQAIGDFFVPTSMSFDNVKLENRVFFPHRFCQAVVLLGTVGILLIHLDDEGIWLATLREPPHLVVKWVHNESV